MVLDYGTAPVPKVILELEPLHAALLIDGNSHICSSFSALKESLIPNNNFETFFNMKDTPL